MNKIGLSVRIIFFRSKNKKGRYILPIREYISTFLERYRRNMSTCRYTHTLGGILTEYREAKK